jgi:hypothetical protein
MGSLIAPSSFLNQKCADFNGTDEYMSRTGASFSGDTAGAWSFWMKTDVVLGANGAVFVLGFANTATQPRFGFGIRRNATTGTGTYVSVVGVSATAGIATAAASATTTALSAGTLYHVVVQSNGTAYSFYINGVAQTVVDWSGFGTLNNGDWFGDKAGASLLTVGCVTNLGVPAGFWNGTLDEMVYLPGRIFTSGEVAEIYNGGTPKNPHRLSMISELTTWYRMGDSRDSAATVFDEIGSNDLTLVNMDASNYVNV